jgi:hypothetical protein
MPDETTIIYADSAQHCGEFLKAMGKVWPGYEFAVIIIEPPKKAKAENRAPLFNFASTVPDEYLAATLRHLLSHVEQPRPDTFVIDGIMRKD